MSKCIIDMFEKTVENFPDHIAVADEQAQMTFAELRKKAMSISEVLKSGTSPVGVVAYRKIETIALFFAVMYSGRCYVPLDPDMPKEKTEKILRNADVSVVLSSGVFEHNTMQNVFPDMQMLHWESLKELSSAPTPCEKKMDNAPCLFVYSKPECTILHEQEAMDLLYLIYTSGSTGIPKGVAKSHEAMKSFLDAYIKEFSFDENTVIGNQTPFCFDASAKDIYLMAACGASMHIIPTSLFSFPIRLIEYMDERKVNFISWVPSALSIVTALNTFSEKKPQYLKRVFFVGEVFPTKHLNRWMEALPHVEYVNLYGSSEICGISCFYRVKGTFDKNESIPAGTALSNCKVCLIHEGAAVQEKETPGEIYVASDALADSYYKDEEKTKMSFLYLDFGEGIRRYYRTGDIAKYNSNGDLVFVARSDHQIKHMGHRIELGEIEAAAMDINGVHKCCCVYHQKRNRILLYVELEASAELIAREIRSSLKGKLSDYMIPHKVQIMERLPLNANGKIDRMALKAALK